MTKRSSEQSKIYLRAAELIASKQSDFSCCAVSFSASEISGKPYQMDCLERIQYGDMFVGEDSTKFGCPTSEIGRNKRVLALLFMSAFVAGEEP